MIVKLVGLTSAVWACGVSAQSSAPPIVTSLFIPDTDSQALAASIISVAPNTGTIYSISCPPTTDGTDCGWGPGLTLTEAGKTKYEGTISETAFVWSFSCNVQGTTSASCVESAGGSEANAPGVTTSTWTGSDMDYIPVTITAGQASLVVASTTQSPRIASTAQPPKSTSTASSTAHSSGGASSNAASKTITSATPSKMSEASKGLKIGKMFWMIALSASIRLFS